MRGSMRIAEVKLRASPCLDLCLKSSLHDIDTKKRLGSGSAYSPSPLRRPSASLEYFVAYSMGELSFAFKKRGGVSNCPMVFVSVAQKKPCRQRESPNLGAAPLELART